MARRQTANPRCWLATTLVLTVAVCGCAPIPRPVAVRPENQTAALPPQAHSPATSANPVLFASDVVVPTSTEPTKTEPKGDAAESKVARPPITSDSAGASATPDKGPSVKLRGRIDADAVTVTQSEKDKALYGNFQNAVGFRRARLGAEGTVGDQVRWVAEFDFAGGDVAFKNVFVAVDHLPIIREVRVGHFLEPFSLEIQTSSTVFPFIERSPQAALDPVRNWGVGIFSYTDDERLVVQFGAFKTGTDSTGNDIDDGNDMAYTGRVTGLPWLDETGDAPRLWHVGGAASQRYPKNDEVTFKQGPQSSLLESNTDNPLIPFVHNFSIPATQFQLFNLQSALALGPLILQAEWSGAHIDQIGGPAVFLYGVYVQTSYFVTGEHHTYNRTLGAFGGPQVRSPFICSDRPGAIVGPGAWELTARLAYLNFADPNLPPTPNGLRTGTKLSTLTLGMNWYLNDHTRFMLNYEHAVPTDPNFGSSTADAVFFRSAIFW